MTEQELRESELALRREGLNLQRARLFVEFAKFGFSGTLAAAIVGVALIFALAGLSAWTSFKIDGWALVAMAVVILVGATAFGFFSLWQAPSIAAKFGEKLQIAIDLAKKTDPAS